MSTFDQDPFAHAIEVYQAKRYEETRDICRSLLESSPDHMGCLYLCGAAEFELGHPEAAERFMRRSLALNPAFPEIHYGFSQVLMALGKYEEALSECLRTIEIKPNHFEAFYSLGSIYYSLKQTDQAEKSYKQALILKPDYLDALNKLGILSYEKGKLEDAIGYFDRALQGDRVLPEVLNNLGAAYIEIKDFPKAVECCERAITLRPEYAAALNNLGNAKRAQGLWIEARHFYERALEIEKSNIEARNNLGLVFLDGFSDPDAAIECFQSILLQNPVHIRALTHLGIAFCHKGSFGEGAQYYTRVLALQPDYRDALNNLGNTLHALGDTDEAIKCYRKVIAARPDDPEGHKNLAMALLTAGDFEEGWREYEWRWQTNQLAAARRDFIQPQWHGENISGQTLLIHAEQGFGDTIQFCRYASLAQARGIKVILEVQPELKKLMCSLAGVEKVVSRGETLPAFDFHCPMLSLPLAFHTQVVTIPASTAYLFAETYALDKWQKRMGSSTDIRVGLVWSGNPRLFSSDLAAADRRRSLPISELAPLVSMKNIEFYCLQKEGARPPPEFNFIDYMAECEDFADTAALIAHLDLVISVDTATAHLAAALGKPVWLLNRYDSCWRWFRTLENSPWYPTVRLFRQLEPGQWRDVIDLVRYELEYTTQRHQK